MSYFNRSKNKELTELMEAFYVLSRQYFQNEIVLLCSELFSELDKHAKNSFPVLFKIAVFLFKYRTVFK